MIIALIMEAAGNGKRLPDCTAQLLRRQPSSGNVLTNSVKISFSKNTVQF
jgi:hypothetical protein